MIFLAFEVALGGNCVDLGHSKVKAGCSLWSHS